MVGRVRQLVGGLILMTVIALISFPVGWVAESEWSVSEPAPNSGAVQCPAALEWLGLGGDVEGAADMPGACRGPLRAAVIAGGIGVLVSILTMGLDRFFSHEATT